MKKLIILSAIALSGLVYNSANAQERFNASIREDRNNDARNRFGREHREYVKPVYNSYHAPVIDRYRVDERSYPGYRHDSDIRCRDRR